MALKGLLRRKGLVILLPLFHLLSSPVLYNTASSRRVYAGQYIIFSSWLSCVSSPQKAVWLSLPDFEGFWIKEISPPRRTAFLPLVRKGCWGYNLRTWIITPMKPGRMRIGGGRVRVNIKGRDYLLSGNAIRVRVLPVPEGTMWTGPLSLEVKPDPVSGKVELGVKVEGEPALIPSPEISLQKGELTLVATTETRQVKAGRVFGEKKFLYMAKGRVEGLVFSYRVFSLKRRKLLEVKTPSLSLEPRLFRPEEISPLPPSSSSLPISFRMTFWVVSASLFFLSLIFISLSLLRQRRPSSKSRVKQILARVKELSPEHLLEELSPWLDGELKQQVDHLRFSPKINRREYERLLEKIRERFS